MMSKRIYNYHPETGEFLSTASADASPLEQGGYLVPAFATEIVPPSWGVRQVAVFSAGVWQIKADWRGVPLYSTADGSTVAVDAIGQTPAGAGATEVPPPTAQTMENIIYIHEKIMKAVLPLLEEYDLELSDLIGEMNIAAWSLSVMSEAGIEKLIAELNKKDVPNGKVE